MATTQTQGTTSQGGELTSMQDLYLEHLRTSTAPKIRSSRRCPR